MAIITRYVYMEYVCRRMEQWRHREYERGQQVVGGGGRAAQRQHVPAAAPHARQLAARRRRAVHAQQLCTDDTLFLFRVHSESWRGKASVPACAGPHSTQKYGPLL